MKLKVGKKSGLKYFDIKDVRKWNPCYDPIKHLQNGIRYNAVKILVREDISCEDRLWVVLRTDLVSEKLMRLFAVWCARQVQHLMKDDRSIKALDVAEAFANGLATKEELAAAWAAAWDAARAAAWAAAWAAAGDAARDAARAAAWAAAWAAAGDAQIKKLIEMVKAEGLENIKARGRL